MKEDAIVELIARELADGRDSGAFDRLLKTSILPHDSQATEKLRQLRRRATFILTALRLHGLDVLPVEATEEMVIAGWRVLKVKGGKCIGDTYYAMISAWKDKR